MADRSLAAFTRKKEAARQDPANFVELTNSAATRNLPITDTLRDNIQKAIKDVFGEGFKAQVYSGGQPTAEQGGKRVGSTRHDNGKAADVYIVGPDGKRVTGDALVPLARYWNQNKLGGFGLQMKDGGIHLDEHTDRAPAWAYGNETAGQQAIINEAKGVSQAVPGNVLSALKSASAATGININFLTNTARVESGFNPNARSGASSAAGIFQFLDQTWLQIIKDHGAARGLGAEAAGITRGIDGKLRASDAVTQQRLLDLRKDPEMAAHMGAQLAKANQTILRGALGREPTDADLYVAHFLGSNGARSFLTGLRDNPDRRAAELVSPETVAANRSIFLKEDGSPRTAKEVYDRFAKRLEGGTPVSGPDAVVTGNRTGREPIPFIDLQAAPNLTPGRQWTEAEREVAQMNFRGERAGALAALQESVGNNITGRILSLAASSQFTPEPGFVLDPKVHFEGIPKEYQDRFAAVLSNSQASEVRRSILAEIQTKEQLAFAGLPGTLGTVAGAFMDPAAIAIGVATGGLATAAQGALRVGAGGGRLLQGVAGAAGNLAVEGGIYALGGEQPTTEQLLISTGIGLTFGAAFGRLAQNPGLAEETAALTRMGQALAQGEGAPTAAAAPVAATADGAIADLAEVTQADVLKSQFGAARWSTSAQVGRSENPLARAVGSALLTDSVGQGAAQGTQAADQMMQRLYLQSFHRWRSGAVPLYNDWAQEKGLSLIERMPPWSRGWRDFQEEVSLYVRETDAARAAQFSPAVQKQGEIMRSVLADWAERLRLAGVGGAEELTPNPNYVPRMWSPSKITTALGEHGEDALIRTVAGALIKGSYNLDEPLAMRMAKATIRNSQTRYMDNEDGLSALFKAAGDEAKLTKVLQEEFGLAGDDLKTALGSLRSTQTVTPANLRHRMSLYESHEQLLPNGKSIRLSDLLENNADDLMGGYLRRMAGRVALAETKVYSQADGRLLISGIRSDNEFESLIGKIKDSGAANPEQSAKDIENLRWAYDRILGRPDPSALGEVAQWAKLVRMFNFARLMGQIGLAQMMDIGRMANSAGLKSFMQHSGGFQRIRDMDGSLVLKHGIDRELEASFGMGSDPLRAFVALNHEDPGGMQNLHRGKFVDRANNVMAGAGYVVSQASGMNYINQWLTLVTGRIAAQKFANIAAKPGKLSASDRNLLGFLGLNADQQARIVSQVKTHFTLKDGELFGRKVTAMNLDKWTDIEARAAFENALFKFSRSAVQQAEIGNLSKVMSTPLAQVLLQFRSYSLTAYENQLLQGLATRDSRQAMMALGSTISGGLVYMAQVHLQAIGRSDAQEFTAKRLNDPMKFGLAVFQRTGFSSVIPMVADTVLSATPAGPLFDSRVSGQPSDFLFGSPTIGLLNDAAKTSKALMTSTWNGVPMTQAQLRDLQRLSIFGNTMPLLQTYNAAMADRPSR